MHVHYVKHERHTKFGSAEQLQERLRVKEDTKSWKLNMSC